MDSGRQHDIKEVEKGLKSSDPNIRDKAHKAGERIKNERHDKRVVEMRKRMIEETKKGRGDNANDIREDIQKHQKGGFGRTSFTFTGLDKIFKDR